MDLDKLVLLRRILENHNFTRITTDYNVIEGGTCLVVWSKRIQQDFDRNSGQNILALIERESE